MSHWKKLSLLAGGLVSAGAFATFKLGGPASWAGREEYLVSLGIGLALVVFALVAEIPFSRVVPSHDTAGTPDDPLVPPACESRRYTTLFIASFVALFVELLVIRYTGSQIRVLAYFKNIPLIASFLGLGLGLCLGRGGTRSAMLFLLWLVPVAAVLSGGAPLVDNYLGLFAQTSSSEQVFGPNIGQVEHPLAWAVSVTMMAGFSVAALVTIMMLFSHLGRLLADAFEGVPRLAGYTVNILGSLAGILGFSALSLLETPPWIWFLIGLTPLLWWTSSRGQRLLSMALIGACVVTVLPSHEDTVWSRYQKLVGREVVLRSPDGEAPGYLIQISEVFYQVALDLRPEAVRRYGFNPHPQYDASVAGIPLDNVLIVGAGSGNDVAAALRNGAGHVDAVDIDPAIVRFGAEHHPEQPYSDPRVNVIIEDARQAFRELDTGTYDAIVFGLLDSHTQLGMSSVRLDNYVYTEESFAAAADLLKPGGQLVVIAAAFRPWLSERVETMLTRTCGHAPELQHFAIGTSFRCAVGAPPGALAQATSGSSSAGDEAAASSVIPTDDWPFFYLPRRSVPGAYLFVVGLLALVSVLVLRKNGLSLGGFSAYHGHLFFLGAAFLLMEVYAINRLALLFGTTWLVSAVAIGLVLTLIVLANLTVALFGTIGYGLSYAALAVSLAVSYSLSPAAVLGEPLAVQYAYGLAVLLPVFFAGIIFARSFRMAEVAGTALGANIFGSAVGGWIEYSTMVIGIRSLVLVAAASYLASYLYYRRSRAAVPARTSLPEATS